MSMGAPGKVRARANYSGTGRYPNNIDAMRKAHGVAYKTLVANCGLSGSNYMKLVRGERPLSDQVAARLAKVIGCSVEALAWKGPPAAVPSAPTQDRKPGRELVPYKAKAQAPALPAQPEAVEITIAVGGRLVGGLTMFDPKAMRRVIRDAFGDDDE